MDKAPIDFTPLTDAQVALDLNIPVQIGVGNALPAGEYRFSLQQLIGLVASNGYLKVIAGLHVNEAAAIAAGGLSGQGYRLAPNNTYNIPVGDGGVVKIIA